MSITQRRDDVERRISQLLTSRGLSPETTRFALDVADDDHELRLLLVEWQGACNEVRALLGLYAQTPELPPGAEERRARQVGDWAAVERHSAERKAEYERLVASLIADAHAAPAHFDS
jgi:hypothetical protein